MDFLCLFAISFEKEECCHRTCKNNHKDVWTVVENNTCWACGIFSICYFTATWVISSKLNVNYEEGMYSQKIACIENNAVLYAKANDKLFEKDKTIYVTVDDLAKANAVISSDGEVIDPRDEKSSMNDIKVKLTMEGDKITAKVLS